MLLTVSFLLLALLSPLDAAPLAPPSGTSIAPVSTAVSLVPQGAVQVPAEADDDEAEGGGDPAGNPVPEPATLLLVGTGLVWFALSARRSRRPART